ncbi:MAG: glutamyl-tRNA amidotransferase [Candidatus Tectomicrobia bacterium RIFCSPLOWO2_12_FULL_69_37]|nr:MAG: glutamyl-tRNA amidotransferase [Candidatus Tectomicrobia bacterium RIFCSPLOWO2_02_FULL_70_19]OGL64651.1 MAG: glutamyl-tRNA amidotransferase [Candidatus Tectomicrobia bacterium RIFCSPLOWO2_12_FULL_69_37]
MELAQMTAAQAAEAIRAGQITSEELVAACLERIASLEERVGAWAFLDRELALAQAREADLARREGKALGSLHGVPVGVKDIFDTKDMPTEDGTVLHSGHRPDADATAVALLRQAGAVILGKTVTTELAVYSPGKTRNPHDPERTPGGSSSGSAAAVAAHMVPVAIGTQTNGSTIRPASFCGVYGFKPSHGLIPRHRMLQQSRPLDHVGVFGRTIEDVALAAEAMMAYDENDPDTRPRARPSLVQTAAGEPPVPPRLAFIKTPVWEQAEEDTKAAFAELMAHLGEGAEEVQLPGVFNNAVEWHRTIFHADLARSFEREYAQGKEKLSPVLREMIEHGQKVLAVDYNRAVENRALLVRILDEIFKWYDAVLTPAAPGEAPQGLGSTGSPVFCTLWTLCGMPAVSVPLLEGSSGMPMGAQLVAPKGGDARLLQTARWLVGAVEA